MKKLMSILTLVLVLCLGLTGCAADKKDAGEKKAQAAEIGVTVGKIAPAFQLKDLDGNVVSINVAKDKKLYVLNFWATWCPPCRAEMPDLERFYQEQKEKVQFYAINLDEPADKVKDFVRSNGFTFPVLSDKGGTIGGEFKVNAIPTTLVIDQQGVIRLRKAGTITEAELNSVLRKLAGEK